HLRALDGSLGAYYLIRWFSWRLRNHEGFQLQRGSELDPHLWFKFCARANIWSHFRAGKSRGKFRARAFGLLPKRRICSKFLQPRCFWWLHRPVLCSWAKLPRHYRNVCRQAASHKHLGIPRRLLQDCWKTQLTYRCQPSLLWMGTTILRFPREL